jgi:hypothetical protein
MKKRQGQKVKLFKRDLSEHQGHKVRMEAYLRQTHDVFVVNLGEAESKQAYVRGVLAGSPVRRVWASFPGQKLERSGR